MDCGSIYIKMCEKAEEIQEQWLEHDTEGDYAVVGKMIEEYNGFWTLKKGSILIVGNDGEYDLTITNRGEIDGTGAIWLPRQDQLQEMVDDKAYAFTSVKLAVFFGNNANYLGLDDSSSMEQLWLAFVMKEKYQKVWNGEEWGNS